LSVTAGTAIGFTVTAYDAYGNTATGYSGTVQFTSSDARASLAAKYTFAAADDGSHVFANAVTFKTAGVQSFTATDTVKGTIAASQNNFAVSPAAASSLTLAGFPNPSTAGTVASFTVTALDPYGNLATGYLGTVHFTSGDSKAVLPANYKFAATDEGQHAFSVTFKTAGSESISATDSANAAITGQTSVSVGAGPAKSLVFGSLPGTAVAGTAHTFTLTAKDAYGNIATGYTGTVSFTSSDAQGLLPANYTFTLADAGIHTFSNGITLKTAGEQTFTATDTANSALTVTRINFQILAAAAKKLVVSGFPSAIAAGTAGSFTVTLYDAYGNIATGYSGTVHFRTSAASASLPANYTFSSANAGVHTFSATLNTSGTQSITATDTVTTSITGSQTNIDVTDGRMTLPPEDAEELLDEMNPGEILVQQAPDLPVLPSLAERYFSDVEQQLIEARAEDQPPAATTAFVLAMAAMWQESHVKKRSRIGGKRHSGERTEIR
jgi:hypothetical protein